MLLINHRYSLSVLPLLITLLIPCGVLIAAPPPVNRAAVLDFDGDGKSDYAVVRMEILPGESVAYDWYIKRSSDGGMTAQRFGSPSLGDQVVPGDYDGDGKWDLAVWRNGGQEGAQAYFYIWQSQSNSLRAVPWGIFGDDILETQDFDGDGKADPTVVRGVGAGLLYWYSLLSRTGEFRAVQFGYLGDKGIRGDFDGDGKADIGVFRRGFNGETPPNTFFILHSSDGQVEASHFGNYETDTVVPGDFDGDGKTDIAVARSDNGQRVWYWRRSSDGIVVGQQFGLALSNPIDGVVPGDYDGDGITDPATRRITGGFNPGYFYVNGSRDGFITTQWGISTGDTTLAYILQAR